MGYGGEDPRRRNRVYRRGKSGEGERGKVFVAKKAEAAEGPGAVLPVSVHPH